MRKVIDIWFFDNTGRGWLILEDSHAVDEIWLMSKDKKLHFEYAPLEIFFLKGKTIYGDTELRLYEDGEPFASTHPEFSGVYPAGVEFDREAFARMLNLEGFVLRNPEHVFKKNEHVIVCDPVPYIDSADEKNSYKWVHGKRGFVEDVVEGFVGGWYAKVNVHCVGVFWLPFRCLGKGA